MSKDRISPNQMSLMAVVSSSLRHQMTFTSDSIYAEVGMLYKKSHNCSSPMYLTKTFPNICGEKLQQYLKDRFYQSGSLVQIFSVLESCSWKVRYVWSKVLDQHLTVYSRLRAGHPPQPSSPFHGTQRPDQSNHWVSNWWPRKGQSGLTTCHIHIRFFITFAATWTKFSHPCLMLN